MEKEILEIAAICLYLFHGGFLVLVQIWRSMSLGGAYPLPLMSKGENEAEDLRLPSSPKGEIVGIMIQVLSLMATHSGDK
jgi:hypothetical protein